LLDAIGDRRLASASPIDMTLSRSTLPIVAHATADIGASDRQRVERLASRLLAAEPALATVGAFGRDVRAGMRDGPALLFEDHTDIALFSGRGDATLQYRSLLLAGEGDVVLIGGERSPAFEAYCRDTLALGAPTIVGITPATGDRPGGLALRCTHNDAAMAAIARAAHRQGRLTLIPYIGTGSAWVLAGKLAELSGADIFVAAPPPRLTRRVNDKLWFASCVAELLGGDALPPSYHAFGPAALTGRVAALARRWERVVIKVPDSAGSAGNLVLHSADIRDLPLRSLRLRLLRLLRNLGWRSGFPLMVGVWETAVLGSPSVQTWIPLPEQGLPIVEGVFDQNVEGSAGEFVGAVACRAPARWLERLTNEAMLIACLFQRLGYFGRCSFDSVITGEDYDRAAVRWIECNGRWGGTSIPMTLANRLIGDWATRPLMIVQRTGLSNPPGTIATALARLGTLMFRGKETDAGVVLLTPGGLEEGSGLHFMLLGRSNTDVDEQAQTVGQLLQAAE
jgi:hypothetical protein